MISIRIGEAERELGSNIESWINEQITRRRADKLSVCVRIIVKEEELDLILSTPTCASSGGGSRQPRPREKRLIDLWRHQGLNKKDFTGDNVISFLRQLSNIV